MNKQLRRALCLLTCTTIAMPMVPLGSLRAFAQEEAAFSWFTGVSVTCQNGDPLPALVARDADVRIGLSYALPAELTDGAYAFTLPQAVTTQVQTRSFSMLLGDTRTADIYIGEDGICSVTMSTGAPSAPDAPASSDADSPSADAPAVPDADSPSADAPAVPDADSPSADVPSRPTPDTDAALLNMGTKLHTLVAFSDAPDSEPEAPEAPEAPPSDPDHSAPPVEPSAPEPDSGLLSGTFYFDTQLDPAFLLPQATGLSFQLGGAQTFEVAIPFESQPLMRGPSAKASDFSVYFTAVLVSNPDGSALSEPTAKDAPIRATFEYEIPAGGLAINTDYTFTMPTVLLGASVPGISIQSDGVEVGTVTIDPATGASKIRFTEASVVAAGTTGSFYMGSKLKKEEIPNGTSKLTFQLGPAPGFEQNINFLLDQMTGSVAVTNTANLEKDKSRVKWVVTVTPALLNADVSPAGGTPSAKELQDFVVSNALNLDAQHTLFFDSADAATYPTVTKKNGSAVSTPAATWTPSGTTLTCALPNGDWAAGDSYELVFYTKYDLGVFEASESKVDLTNTAAASFKYAQYNANSSAGNVQLTSAAKSAVSTNEEATAEVSAMLLSKNQTYNKSTHKITWTLEVNKDAVAFSSPLDVTDLLPTGLKLESVIIDGSPASPGAAAGSYTFTPGATGSPGYTGGTLVLNQLTSGAAHTVTYVTEIDPHIWQTKENQTFENSVSYWGDYGTGPGYTFRRTKKATYNFGGASGGLIGGSGKYDATNHTLTWTIKVNDDTTAFTGGTITITIPGEAGKAQSFADGGCTTTDLAGASIGNYDSTARTVTVTLDDADITGTLTVVTTVDDPNHWATNRDGVEYSLPVRLQAGSINLTATPKTKTTSKVIAKSSDGAAGYDFNKKQIAWKVEWNQNKMAMTNPVITDILPAGLAYVDGSAVVTGATIKNVRYDADTRQIDVSFENITRGAAAPTLTFKTHITDEQLLRCTDGSSTSAKIKNTASIAFNEMPAVLEAPATLFSSYERTVGTRPLAKSGAQNSGFRNYTWTVAINPNQIAMTTPALEDQLAANLVLDLESVRLYEAEAQETTGALTQKALVYDGSNPAAYPDYSAQLAGQKFTFSFLKDISTAYLLSFETDNLNPYSTSYQNSVVFVGQTNSSAGLDQKLDQIAASGGSTNPKRGTIQLTAKEQGTNKPLANVKYTVTGKTTGFTHTVTTGADGVALFTPLKFEAYQVTEDLTGVAGFTALQSPPARTISAGDRAKADTLLYSKGSAVTLDYRPNATDTTGATPPQKTYASGAVVTVPDNPFTRAQHVFDGWSTKPDGTGIDYAPGDTFTLTANTILYAQWHKAAGTITLTAKSTETPAVLFPGLAYTLRSDVPGAQPMTKTTDAAGTVAFDVDLGTYTLETQSLPSPDGYLHQSTSKTAFPILSDSDTDAAWLLSERRDARTLFGLLNVWTLSITAYLLIKASTLYMPDLWARTALALVVNLLFSYCIYFHLRPPYLQMMDLEKRGWWIACCVPALPSLSIFLMARQLRLDPDTFPTCILVATSTLVCYLVVAKLIGRIHEQQTRERVFNVLSEQVQFTERQMKDIEQRDRQNAILRHDLRHFASVIASCLQKNLYDEALQSVQSLLTHPAMVEPEQRYCKNPTLNALLSTCAQRAQSGGISFHAGVSLGENICVDVMDLAVLLSNTLENAIHACMQQPEGAPREIRLKLYMVGKQLYISIANTCEKAVPISDQTGLPMPSRAKGGHGIGMVSVQTFLKAYGAQTDCVQENGWIQLRIVASARPPKKQADVRSSSKSSRHSILRINLVISAVVVAGFCMAGICSYISFNNLFKADIESVSTLTSENIHVTVNNLMERPINVSLAMAHDTLLQELMRREARDGVTPQVTETIRQYLLSYQKKYHFASVTLTSAKTNAHYHFSRGIARVLSPERPEDQWYFDFLQDESECRLSIDLDKVDDYQVTIFSDAKLQDDKGEVLGSIGIGMRTPYIQQVLADNEQRYNLHAYLIDERGTVQISSGKSKTSGINLFDDPKFAPMQEAILANRTTAEQRWYSDGEVDGYIIARYIENLNWYLVVEKDTAQLQQTMLVQLLAGLLFMVLVVIIVLLISTSIITKYSRALVGQTQRDPLTGLRNRACFEQEQYIYGGRLADYEEFGIGMFDLNNLKHTNEMFGHQAGDEYLRDFAKLLGEAFPCCPVFRIGGDEFATIFLNIGEQEVLQKWEVLRLALERRSQDVLAPNSAAFGYAFRDAERYNTMDAIFKAADRRMCESKKEQRVSV